MSYQTYYPNGWQSGEAGGTPITPEALQHMENGIMQGYNDFAPSGYGYGESCLYVQSANIDEEFLASLAQVYGKLNNQTAQIRFVWKGYFYLGTLWNSGNAGYGTLTAISYARGHRVQRIYSAGVWSDWQHDTPPLEVMTLDDEYQLTKTVNGKHVFTRMINFAALPDTGSKNVAFSRTPVYLTSLQVMLSDGALLGIGVGYDHMRSVTKPITVTNTMTNVHITTADNLTDLTARVIVEYIKE